MATRTSGCRARVSSLHNWNGFIRRKVVPVVGQNYQIAGGEQSVGRVSGNEVNLPVQQRAIEQPKIQNSRLRRKLQTVRAREAGISVRALHELVAKASAPATRVWGRVRKTGEVQPARVFPAHYDRECIVNPSEGNTSRPNRFLYSVCTF